MRRPACPPNASAAPLCAACPTVVAPRPVYAACPTIVVPVVAPQPVYASCPRVVAPQPVACVPVVACTYFPMVCNQNRPLYQWCPACTHRRLFPEAWG